MLPVYLLFILGFALLIKGADWLIDGAVAIARRLNLSEIVIGLTIVAFGTSAPELVVNVVSSIRGAGELVAGDIVGSNIANIALGLGVAGLVAPFTVKRSLVKKEIFIGLVGAFLIYLLATQNGALLTISTLAGLILLAGFSIFIYLLYRAVKSGEHLSEIEEVHKHKHSLPIAGLITVAGLAGLVIGGKLAVDNAIIIAENFGVSESLIGLSLVALGTSLPELVTAIIAMRKKKFDIAVGGIVGSNIFNIFWILGLSAVIRPVVFGDHLVVDIGVLVGITLLFIATIFAGKRYQVARWEAAILLASYVAYMGYIFGRG